MHDLKGHIIIVETTNNYWNINVTVLVIKYTQIL